MGTDNMLRTFEEIPMDDDFISPEGSLCRKIGSASARMLDQEDVAYKVGEIVPFRKSETVEYTPRDRNKLLAMLGEAQEPQVAKYSVLLKLDLVRKAGAFGSDAALLDWITSCLNCNVNHVVASIGSSGFLPNETSHPAAPREKLWNVTMEWGGSDEGTYSTTVLSCDEEHAKFACATEMAKSGEMVFENEAEELIWIGHRLSGYADVYSTESQLNGDLKSLFAKELFGDGPARDIDVNRLGLVLQVARDYIVV